ncbi:MAG: hypothetical protein ABSC06_01925 [Rhodopila sp.]|jgi:ABC-type transporter Mla subunit MlaD
MARPPLQTLLSLRRMQVEQARAALGACLKAEAEVAGTVRSLDEAARRDRETAATWQDAHRFLEISASRLGVLRANRRSAAAALAAAAARSAEARGVVTAAQTAAEAVEQLLSEREAASQAGMATGEQHRLDDITRMRHTVRRRGEPY